MAAKLKEVTFMVDGFRPNNYASTKRAVRIKVAEDIGPADFLMEYRAALDALFKLEYDHVKFDIKQTGDKTL